MIKIEILQTKDEKIKTLFVKGHANSNEIGKDLICAGVSSIVIGGLNALEENDVEKVKCDKGNVEVIVKTDNYFNQIVLKTIITQLETVHQRYPDYVKISRRKE